MFSVHVACAQALVLSDYSLACWSPLLPPGCRENVPSYCVRLRIRRPVAVSCPRPRRPRCPFFLFTPQFLPASCPAQLFSILLPFHAVVSSRALAISLSFSPLPPLAALACGSRLLMVPRHVLLSSVRIFPVRRCCSAVDRRRSLCVASPGLTPSHTLPDFSFPPSIHPHLSYFPSLCLSDRLAVLPSFAISPLEVSSLFPHLPVCLSVWSASLYSSLCLSVCLSASASVVHSICCVQHGISRCPRQNLAESVL